MRTLVTLGIFDDQDVLPTVVCTIFRSESYLGTWLDGLADLREAAEKEYGRPAPDHALFWSAAPEPCDE